MMPAQQRSLLGDAERDLIMAAALSKSPKQVASMALKIDCIKDEIVLNLMGFLMAHYSFGQVPLPPPRYPATTVHELSHGADDDDGDNDDTSDSNCSSAEADYSGHAASHMSSGDDHVYPHLSAAEAACKAVGSSSRFPHSGSAEPMEHGWQPAVESSDGGRHLRRGRSANAGASMAPVPVRSSTARWSPPPSGPLLCVPARSTPELTHTSTAAASAIPTELVEQPIAEHTLQQQQRRRRLLPPSTTADCSGQATANSAAAETVADAEGQPQQPLQSSASAVTTAVTAAAAAGLPSLAEAPADGRPGFTCSHCGRYFKSAVALKFHAAKHLGVEYQCPLCKQCLKTSNSYSNHMKMHSGYDGHRCSVCHKHFMRRHEMVRHVKIVHMGERPFACPDCGAAFATEWNMLRHRKAMHASQGAASTQLSASLTDGPAASASIAAAGDANVAHVTPE